VDSCALDTAPNDRAGHETTSSLRLGAIERGRIAMHVMCGFVSCRKCLMANAQLGASLRKLLLPSCIVATAGEIWDPYAHAVLALAYCEATPAMRHGLDCMAFRTRWRPPRGRGGL